MELLYENILNVQWQQIIMWVIGGLLMHAIGVNVSGQIASVIAGGLILNFFL